jgi:hypothetical protein
MGKVALVLMAKQAATELERCFGSGTASSAGAGLEVQLARQVP